MDIKEIKERKRLLEVTILSLVEGFDRETGLAVKEIDYQAFVERDFNGEITRIGGARVRVNVIIP